MKALTLFSNVGIGETYLKEIGIDVVVANELLPERSNFYTNSQPVGLIINGQINNPEILKNIIEAGKANKIKLIIATPPCQGMSIAGRMQEDDPRNSLIIKALQAFKELKPDYMLIENVAQMFKTSIIYRGKQVKIVDFIKQQIGTSYIAKFDIFDAADYGTPQFRKRAIVRIHKKELTWKEPIKQKHITVRCYWPFT
jgi:DNA (cytosine-5)-methyltransferase 1